MLGNGSPLEGATMSIQAYAGFYKGGGFRQSPASKVTQVQKKLSPKGGV